MSYFWWINVIHVSCVIQSPTDNLAEWKFGSGHRKKLPKNKPCAGQELLMAVQLEDMEGVILLPHWQQTWHEYP